MALEMKTMKKKKNEKFKHKSTEAFITGKLGSGYSREQEWKKPKHWD